MSINLRVLTGTRAISALVLGTYYVAFRHSLRENSHPRLTTRRLYALLTYENNSVQSQIYIHTHTQVYSYDTYGSPLHRFMTLSTVNEKDTCTDAE